MGRPALIFDLDGTLIDSAPDIHAAVNAALGEAALPPLPLDRVKSFIGNGAPVLIERCLGACGHPAPSPLQPAVLAAFLRHYASDMSRTRTFPNVKIALQSAVTKGFSLGICSNKPLAPTHQTLKSLGLDRYFGTVIGGDSLPVRKPDPAPLRAALAALEASSAIFIGDSEVDAETAHAAGMPFWLFLGGYRKGPASGLRHDWAFDDFVSLQQRVDRL
jgi:phosphoglycolate phosphatase